MYDVPQLRMTTAVVETFSRVSVLQTCFKIPYNFWPLKISDPFGARYAICPFNFGPPKIFQRGFQKISPLWFLSTPVPKLKGDPNLRGSKGNEQIMIWHSGDYKKRMAYYDKHRGQLFFPQRSRWFFDAILFFYQSRGILRCPQDVPYQLFVEECQFFQVRFGAMRNFLFEPMIYW